MQPKTDPPPLPPAAVARTMREILRLTFNDPRFGLAAGVSLPPSPYEAWFGSSAHGSSEIEHVVGATEAYARASSTGA